MSISAGGVAGAAAISAGGYAATGNYKKAALMAVLAAANLVGAGAAVKIGMSVATKIVARQSAKSAASAPKVVRANWLVRKRADALSDRVGKNSIGERVCPGFG